jgi:hypothetical protein
MRVHGGEVAKPRLVQFGLFYQALPGDRRFSRLLDPSDCDNRDNRLRFVIRILSHASMATAQHQRKSLSIRALSRPAGQVAKGNIASLPSCGPNPGNHFQFVSCFASQSIGITTRSGCNMLINGCLCQISYIEAKGNIHPSPDGRLRDQAAFIGEKRTATTVKTGQTEQIVSRLSSIRENACYQQKFPLPPAANLKWNKPKTAAMNKRTSAANCKPRAMEGVLRNTRIPRSIGRGVGLAHCRAT